MVASVIETVEVVPHAGRLGRYIEIRQGAQSVSVEVGALRDLVAALCEASGVEPISLEIGDRRIVAPGPPLAIPPGEYRVLVVSGDASPG